MAQLSRRSLLKLSGLALAGAGGASLPAFAQRALSAASGQGRARGTFVFLFLRGALDGLYAVTPYGEPRLAQLRPGIALPPPGKPAKGTALPALLELGEPGFGLHPALGPLLPLWKEGTLGLLHAVGSPDPTRSHFDAQDMVELGTPGRKATPDGFLSRALVHAPRAGYAGQAAPPGPSAFEAVALSPRIPRSLQGDPHALAFSRLEELRLRPLPGARGGEQGSDESRAAFAALYGGAEDARLRQAAEEAGDAMEAARRKLSSIKPSPGADYPRGPLGNSLREIARLIRAEVGVRVAFAEAGGWDTHAGQPGVLDRNLRELALSLSAFRRDLGDKLGQVTLIAATEFGRTARENGARGTDHGHGSVAFALGGSVKGGKLHGRWPGLADDQLYEGRDLAVTTDLRSALLSGLQSALGPLETEKVFPGFTGQPLAGLVG